MTHYCPTCGGTRWKTKIKDINYQCRRCGYLGRGLSGMPSVTWGFRTRIGWLNRILDRLFLRFLKPKINVRAVDRSAK